MTDSTSTAASSGENLVDRAAQSADRALEATRRAAGSAIDSVANKVHGLRDQASPLLDRVASPFDSLAGYTREAPLKSLLVAAAVGAGLMALIALLTHPRR